MADPGTVVGIVSLGLQVAHYLFDYYAALKAQDTNINQTLKKLENLLNILESLRCRLDNCKAGADDGLLERIGPILAQSEECIQELQEETRKFQHSTPGSFLSPLKSTARRVAYPIRKGTLGQLSGTVDEITGHLSLALQQDTISRVQEDVDDIKALMGLIRTSQIASDVRDWLKAPDATIDFNGACKKKHPDTGLWFIRGPSFMAWLEKPSSFLWLKGFAGCGKSVLCSTAIQHTFRHRGYNPKIGLAFFFFSFNDERKQDAAAMIRALVLQLSNQLGGDNTTLTNLHENYRHGTPPDQALLDCLEKLVRAFQRDVYILIDALDESPQGCKEQRQTVLQVLNDIRAWEEPKLHLLVTSREEVDIRNELLAIPGETVTMKNDGIDKDIAAFVAQHLRGNPRFRKWHAHLDRIEKVLSERANGVCVPSTSS